MRCPAPAADRPTRLRAWARGAASCFLTTALAACSSQTTSATTVPLDSQQASPAVETAPPTAAAPSPQPATATPADVTQEAAGRFVATPGPAAPAATTVTAGVDYADPQAVAKGYVALRLTYRFDDAAGYTAALTSPAFTTPGFAARSKPSASALARLATSQETSAVQVAGAELANEAPNSASTRYVVVTCTVTTTYRGGDTTAAAWTLRLLQVAPAQWRVDGVLSTD